MLKRFTKGASRVGLNMLNAIVDELNALLAWVKNLNGDEYIYVQRGPAGGTIRLDIDAVLRRVPRPTAQQVMDAKVTAATGSTYTVLLGAYNVTGTWEAFNALEYPAIGPEGSVENDIVQVMPRFTNTTSGETTMTLLAGSAKGALKVLVKANGDVAAWPTYDLYDLSDTGFVTKLNQAGALSPLDSRIRWQSALPPTAAPDGSVGDAFYAVDGTIRLDMCAETLCTSELTVTAGAV
jgi:hypothetical protein